MPVEPDDLRAAAAFAVGTLAPAVDADWSVAAGTLEWDVRFTVVHMAGAPAKYALVLAARADEQLPLRLSSYDGVSNANVLGAVRASADALAHVADTVEPGSTGFHADGPLDAEGFLALACCEVLVHGGDAAAGLGLAYAPDDALCEAVVERLWPDRAVELRGWARLLAATGR